MTDIEKRARHVRAAAVVAMQYQHSLCSVIIREGNDGEKIASLMRKRDSAIARFNARLTAALTPPEGYVLVPVVCTDAMGDAAYSAAGSPTDGWYGFEEMWDAAIAARPEVPRG